MTDLEIAIEIGTTGDQLGKAIDELVARIWQDMDAEERLMRETAFPERDAHLKAHEQLTLSLAEALEYCLRSEYRSLDSLLHCVRTWLWQHGATLDAALAVHAELR